MKILFAAIVFAILSLGAGTPDDEHVIDVVFPNGINLPSAPSWANFIIYWEERMFYAKRASLKNGVLTVTSLAQPAQGKARFFRYRFLVPEDEAVGLIPIFENQVGLGDLQGGGGG